MAAEAKFSGETLVLFKFGARRSRVAQSPSPNTMECTAQSSEEKVICWSVDLVVFDPWHNSEKVFVHMCTCALLRNATFCPCLEVLCNIPSTAIPQMVDFGRAWLLNRILCVANVEYIMSPDKGLTRLTLNKPQISRASGTTARVV